jgi:uncharacterized RDD family membrane protein YckC
LFFDASMNCQNCESPIVPTDERCPRCGAKPLHRRVTFGAKRAEFALTPEEEPFELGETAESQEWQFQGKSESEQERQAVSQTEEAQSTPVPEVRGGGFFRRICAFAIDLAMICALSIVMSFLAYVGYKVGLSAHARAVAGQHLAPLFILLTWGSAALATAYFVVFHGLEGKTIGKWLLGLRVVGEERRTISYRRAFGRWLAMLLFAPLVLGFLWILWSREKRGWHDFVARTWVIRD